MPAEPPSAKRVLVPVLVGLAVAGGLAAIGAVAMTLAAPPRPPAVAEAQRSGTAPTTPPVSTPDLAPTTSGPASATASAPAATAPAPDPVADPDPAWDAAVTEAFARADLADACALLAAPPRGDDPAAVARLRGRLWPWLIDGPPGPSITPPRAVAPPALPDDDRIQHALPAADGGWLAVSWRAAYRCGPDGVWTRTHVLRRERTGGIQAWLRREDAIAPGLVTLTAPTAEAPGAWSGDGGRTWTALTWPAGTGLPSRGNVALAAIGRDRLVLGCETDDVARLQVWQRGGWSDLGTAHEDWSVLPFPDAGLLIDPTRGRQRCWTAEAGWRPLTWIGKRTIIDWPANDRYQTLGVATLPDRCGLIIRGSLHWIGRDGSLLATVPLPVVREREISGYRLVADPRQPDRLWALFAGWGLWLSEDAGATWRRGRGPLAELDGWPLFAGDGELLTPGWRWTIDAAAFAAPPAAPERSPSVAAAVERARARAAAAPAALVPDPPLPDGVLDGLRREREQAPTALAGLMARARTASTAERCELVRLLTAAADEHGSDGLTADWLGQGGSRPLAIVLQGDLPLGADDLAEGPRAVRALLAARIRAISASDGNGRAEGQLRAAQQAERLLTWLEAAHARDPATARLRAEFEAAVANPTPEGGSVIFNARWREAWGDRTAAVAEACRATLARSADALAAEAGTLARIALIDALLGDPGARERAIAAATALDRAIAAGHLTPTLPWILVRLRAQAAKLALDAQDEAAALSQLQALRPYVRRDGQGGWHGTRAFEALDRIVETLDERARQAGDPRRKLALRRVAATAASALPLDWGHSMNGSERLRAINNLAWDLCTLPDRDLHDPTEALRWATLAVQSDHRRSAMYLDTLALAQLRTGDRAGAVRTQEESVAALAADARDRGQYLARLALYRRLHAEPGAPLPEAAFTGDAGPAKPVPAAEPPRTPTGADGF